MFAQIVLEKKKIQLVNVLSLLCHVCNFTLDWILWCLILLHGLQYGDVVTGGIDLALCAESVVYYLRR